MRSDKCKDCKRKTFIYAKEQCISCYQKSKRKMAECIECKESKFMFAKGLCEKCYFKKRAEAIKNKKVI